MTDSDSSTISLDTNNELSEEEKIILTKIAHAVRKSIDFYGGVNSHIFYDDPDDGYSGLSAGSRDIIKFGLELIKTNKHKKFIENPDIFDFIVWGPSCANSSCYYFEPQDKSERDISVDFANEIFSIIHD